MNAVIKDMYGSFFNSEMSKFLQRNEQIALFVILKFYSFLLRKSYCELLRICIGKNAR